jgi:alcohol dehydrogenase
VGCTASPSASRPRLRVPTAASRGRSGCSAWGSLERTVRPVTTDRAPSDDAVREGNVVLVHDIGPDLGGGLPAVRHAGDSVLLMGARDVPGPDRAAPPPRLSKFHAPEIVFGPDSVQEAAHAAVRLGARRPFVVTDPGLLEAGWPSELLTHLRATGLSPQLWFDVTPNPKDVEIEAGFARYVESGCDVVLGIGGGSVMDAAKGVALLAANGGRILDYEGIDRIEHPIPPMIMLPSTSGTGADVSQFCIVTDTERHTKITIMGRALVPDVSVIDPRLLETMPDDLNAATGLDALTHGIEAFVSLAHGPLTDHHALQAVSLVHGNLVRTMTRPHDSAARCSMAQAALEAGLAFTNAILGATHAMSHQVGGMLDLPHGVVNGVLLPHVIRFNGATVPERFVPIAQAMGLPAVADEAVERVADEVRRLGDEVGVPKGLGDLGVTDADVPRLAELTLGDACLTTNPRTATAAQVAELFRAAL